MTDAGHDHTHPVSYGKGVADALRKPSVELRHAIPQVYDGFRELHDSALADGVLSRKHKELIALAMAIGTQCDGCIASHARGCVVYGATAEEVAETIGVTLLMMGGPGTVYGPRAFAAFQEFAAERAAKG